MHLHLAIGWQTKWLKRNPAGWQPREPAGCQHKRLPQAMECRKSRHTLQSNCIAHPSISQFVLLYLAVPTAKQQPMCHAHSIQHRTAGETVTSEISLYRITPLPLCCDTGNRNRHRPMSPGRSRLCRELPEARSQTPTKTCSGYAPTHISKQIPQHCQQEIKLTTT